MTLDGTMILTHGGALAMAASVLIMGSLRYNPRLFLRHFPEKVRTAQAPLSAREKATGRVIGLLLIALFAAAPIWSTLEFSRTRAADPISLWTHAFLVGMIANLVDWLVLDEAWLGLGRPRWALPNGVEPADLLPFDHMKHFRGFLVGTILFAIVAFIAMLAATFAAPSGPRASVILADEPAEELSDYGFFLDAGAREPAPGVVRYDLINALFSDHAVKHRLVYVPRGEAVAYSADKAFEFPVGSVLIKTFAFAPDMREPATDERYIETRLLIRKPDGWVAYPYIWNAEETEATYAPVGGRVPIETMAADGEKMSINYGVPNRNQCKECHQSGDALIPLGPKARNLNHIGPGGVNQIADWSARGMLSGAPPASPAVPPAADASASLSDRARSWLDVNCAHCHKADGSASNSGLFLDWTETDPAGWGVHKRPTAAGRGSGRFMFVIEPGKPDESIMVYRMASTEPGVMMPELGRTVVDPQGLALVREWIASLPPVPQ
jgi:uncharacterized repeat protein (TIGR03806 family)